MGALDSLQPLGGDTMSGSNLNSTTMSPDGPTPATSNNFTDGTSPGSILDGELSSAMEQTGTLYNGKGTFDNSVTGYILGVDDTITVPTVKFYIGTPTSYFNFDGTNVVLSGTLTASTIIGSTLQTAATGQMIRVTATTASSPSQTANSLMLIDANGHSLLQFGSNSSVIQTINPWSDVFGLLIENDISIAMASSSLLSVQMQNTSSATSAVMIGNDGLGDSLFVSASASATALYVTTTGSTVSSADLVHFENSKGGDTLRINANFTSGRGININIASASNSSQPLYITNAGTGSSQISQTAGGANPALELDMAHAGTAALFLTNSGISSMHFKSLLLLGTVMIWLSDGTSPNGNLSANLGDICVGGSSGHMFWNNNGSSGWTQI